MIWEEAKEQARKTGGTIDWSKEKGFFVTVTPGVRPSTLAEKFFTWTAPGEGWNLPWNIGYTIPGKGLTAYPGGTPQLSWPAQQQLQQIGYQTPLPNWLTMAQPTAEQLQADYEAAQAALEAAQAVGTIGLGDKFVRLETMDGYVVPVYRDKDGNEYMAWTEAQISRGEEAAETTPQWRPGELEFAQKQWKAEQALAEKQFEWQQEQWRQQLEAERQQRLAQLAAQPVSWLQYGLESGLGSQVQPWMVPLMQGAPGAPQAIAGQPLTTGKEKTLTGLPELTTPSMQYWARMTPSMQQQMYGYEQARTGALPEDVYARQWMRSAPAGQFPQLRYAR